MQILRFNNREDFRLWLKEHAATEKECFAVLRRGRPRSKTELWYLDAVEEALCFGWIDSTQRKVDGVLVQRFSPRKKNALWTPLNRARVRRLERLNLMTDAGRAVLPPETEEFDPDVVAALKSAGVWETFLTFPDLYQEIRVYNVAFYKKRSSASYERALHHLIEQTRKGKLYGEWNDYGRLSEDN